MNDRGQNALLRAAMVRVTVLLLISVTFAFGWEASRLSGAQPVNGLVVKSRAVFAGKGGDSREFTIRYAIQGRDYVVVVRRGILDALGSLRGLRCGDRVPLAVDPLSPDRATLDTVSGRYGITLCFAVLGAGWAAVAAAWRLKGRWPL